jgi:S1-C subfamily serine protease
VQSVGRGTPAEKAGLVVNDVIVAVDERPLDEEDGLTMALSVVPVGAEVNLTVRRLDQDVKLKVFVSKYPVSGQVIATNRPKPWRGLRVDFPSVLTNAGAFDFNLMSAMAQGGVGVVDVLPGSAADQAGLRRNQIVTEVDGHSVSSPAEFAKATSSTDGKDVTLTTTQPGAFGERKIVIPK